MPTHIVPPSGLGAGSAIQAANITGLSSRQVVFGSSVGGVAQDANLQYDSTNDFLGIGTSAPLARIHAVGASSAVGAYIQDHLVVGSTIAPVATIAGVQVLKVGGAYALNGFTGGQLISLAGAYIGSSGEYHRIDTARSPVSLSMGDVFQVLLGSTGAANSTIAWTTGLICQLIGAQAGVGFLGAGATTRGAAITTNTPAAVYTSVVGAQVNQLTEALRLKGIIS